MKWSTMRVEFLTEAIERSLAEFIQLSNIHVDLVMEAKLKKECKRFIDQILELFSQADAEPIIAVQGISPLIKEEPAARAHSNLEDEEIMIGWNFPQSADDDEEIEERFDKGVEVTEVLISPSKTKCTTLNDRDNKNENTSQSALAASSSSTPSSTLPRDSNSDQSESGNLKEQTSSSTSPTIISRRSNSTAFGPKSSSSCRKPASPRKRVELNRARRERRLACDECPRKFRGLHELAAHKALHANPNTFQCHICLTSLTTSYNLRQHMKVHTQDESQRKSHECTICGAKFMKKSYLSVHHQVKHNDGKREYICEICGKALPHRLHLVKHMKISHPEKEREKNFECEKCGKKFVEKFQLKTHMKVHSEVKAFTCENCGQGFKYFSTLTRHQRLQRKNCRPLNQSLPVPAPEPEPSSSTTIVPDFIEETCI